MVTKVIALIVSLCIVAPAAAQTVDTLWARYYDETEMDVAKRIGIDAAGNIYACGAPSWTVIKYYPNGDIAWFRQQGGEVFDMVVNDAGEVFMTGDGYTTIKMNTDGDVDWSFTFGGGRGNAISLDASGNVYTTGYAYIDGTTGTDYLTIKHYPNGDTAWARTYSHDSYGHDYANDVAVDPSGNVYVTGQSDAGAYLWDFVTVAYDSDGNELWSSIYHGVRDDIGLSIDVDASGYACATGHTKIHVQPFMEDYLTIRYSPSGDTLWTRRYNGLINYQDKPCKVIIDQTGDIYVTGTSYGTNERDYVTLKYNPDGDRLWRKIYYSPGPDGSDWAIGMCLDQSGNVFVTGRSSYEAGELADWATVKYYPDGTEAFVARFNGPGDGRDYGYDVVVGSDNKFYVVGYVGQTPEYLSDFDFTVVAYYQLNYGDADGSGEVDIDDVVYLIAYIFSGGPAPVPYAAGDADCSGDVDIDDVVYLIAYIFSGGPPPGDPDDDGEPDC